MSQSSNVKAGITALENLLGTWGASSQRGAITDQEYCELLEEMIDRATTALEARREETGGDDPVASMLAPPDDDPADYNND